MQWIKCSDRMPENINQYLVWSQEEGFCLHGFHKVNKDLIEYCSSSSYDHPYPCEKVTHWMRLPPQPLANDLCDICQKLKDKKLKEGKEIAWVGCCKNKACSWNQQLHECHCISAPEED